MNAQMFGIVCSVLDSLLGSLLCLGVAMGCCGMITNKNKQKFKHDTKRPRGPCPEANPS